MADLYDQIAQFDPVKPQLPGTGGSGDIYDQIAKFDPMVSEAVESAIVLPDDPRKLREPVAKTGTGPGFKTLWKAAFVEDPETMKRIYAKAEFPEMKIEDAMKRYSMRGKNLVFRNRLGRLEAVHPDKFLSKLKSLTALTLGQPAIPLSILGTVVGGVVGAGAGAGTGEAIRRFIGHEVFQEPTDKLGIALGVAAETGLGAVSELGGRVFAGAINRTMGIGKPVGRTVGKIAMGDMKVMTPAERKLVKAAGIRMINPLADVAEMERIQGIAKRFNIELNLPQMAGNKSLINRFSLLGDLAESSDLIQEALKTQNIQIQNAVPRFLNTLAEDADPFYVGGEIRQAARDAIKGLKGKRAAASKPWYEKAFANEDIAVDVEPVINYIDTELQTAKGSIRNELLRAKKIIEVPDLPRKLAKEDYGYAGVGYNVKQVKDLKNTWKIDIYDDDMLTGIRGKIDDVLHGEPGGRKPIDSGYGPDEGEWMGYSSTYPHFMVNKGWSADEVITALEKGFNGENLGIQQAEIVEAALGELEAERVARGYFDPAGGLEAIEEIAERPGVKYTGKYDTSLKGLHGSKMEFDDIIKNARQTGMGNTIKRNYVKIKDILLEQMDTASPDYAQARLIHAINSPMVESAEKGAMGALANMKDTNIAGAATQLLASKNTSPEQIVRMRRLIQRYESGYKTNVQGMIPEEGGIWNSALRDFIRFRFENLKESQVSEISNIGGALRKAVFGNERQRKILKAAMSPSQYRNLTDFMEILRRTGLTYTKESTTATRQMELRAFQRELGADALQAVTSPTTAPKRLLADRIDELRFGRGARQMAERILHPSAGEQLKRIKRLSPRGEELARAITVFIGLESPAVQESFTTQTDERANE
uniref:Uncharacterized protein n=2 Tax=viral metagenome TaxID=1070528 RepID=A0A6M3IZ09_9ZZZZ